MEASPTQSPAQPGDKSSVLHMSLWSLAWPMFIDLLLSMTLGLEDTYYLAMVSDTAAGAVGALLPLMGACHMIFQTFANSGGSVAAQLMGGRRFERVNQTFQSIVLLNGSMGAGVAILLFALHAHIGRWLGLHGEGLDMTIQFLQLGGLIIFIQALRFAMSAIINTHGRPRWNVYGAVLVNVLNVVFNHLLTRGPFHLPKLGVPGIALSTILSQLLGLALSIYFIHTKLKVRWDFKHYWNRLRFFFEPILRIGAPSALEPVSFQLNQTLLIVMTVSIGEVALATRTYVMNLLVFAVVWAISLSMGNQIKVAHLIGAKEFETVHRQLMKTLKLGVLAGFAAMLGLCLISKPLLLIFTKDPRVISLGQTLFYLGLLLEPLRACNIIVGMTLRASGDAKFPATVSVLLTWGVAIPLAYLLAFHFHLGLVGLWIGMICDEAIRGTMNLLRWRTGIWKAKGVLAREGA
jgi:putative MATE family efflux protein